MNSFNAERLHVTSQREVLGRYPVLAKYAGLVHCGEVPCMAVKPANQEVFVGTSRSLAAALPLLACGSRLPLLRGPVQSGSSKSVFEQSSFCRRRLPLSPSGTARAGF